MKVGEGPVHQVEVEVIEPQIGKRIAAGNDYIALAVLVVPQLRSDPKLLALHSSAKNLLQRRAHGMLIAIH
jgi:hypothetical protein